jgi:hypothetical protein
MRKGVSLVMILVLPAVVGSGCATHRKNLIARDLGYLEQGVTLRDVHLVLRDGTSQDLKRGVVAGDTLRGTTVDGRQVVIATTEIVQASREGVDTQKTVLALVPLAVVALVAWGLALSLGGEW